MKPAALVVMFALTCLSAFAQQECSSLLEHGIYDHLRDSDVRSSASQMKSDICTAYEKMQRDVISGNVKASYGLFDGQASMNRSQLESISQQMCKSDFSQSAAASTAEHSSSVIDPDAVAAWRDCLQLYADGLRVKTSFRESDQGAITLAVRYVAPAGQLAKTRISQVVLTPKDAFKNGLCQGDLMVSQPREIATEELGMTCERLIGNQPQMVAGRPVLAPAATIQILTDAGPVVRHLAAVSPPQTGPSVKEVTQTVLSQAITSDVRTGSGCTRILDIQICWGKQEVQPFNTDPDVRKFDFQFPQPFSEKPVVTNGIEGTTSGFAFSVYSYDLTTTGYSGNVMETTHRLATSHVPFSEGAVMNYIAIGKWR